MNKYWIKKTEYGWGLYMPVSGIFTTTMHLHSFHGSWNKAIDAMWYRERLLRNLGIL